ncbi:MAG: sulfite exporter TauE/SafE family protein [Euryarchaeota archaeon]|nr:sulfite exporter TauE/SafE family protein [Euryarchaeota archaeon]
MFYVHSVFSNIDVNILVIFAYGIIVGTITALLGAGGGTLIVPFLTLYVGMPIRSAIGTSLFQVTGIAASGAYQHYKYGSADLKLAAILISSGSVMAYVGATLAQRVPGNALKVIFGVFVILIALKFMRSPKKSEAEHAFKYDTAKAQPKVKKNNLFALILPVAFVSSLPLAIKRTCPIGDYTIDVPKILLLGGSVGLLAGLLGVGGGFLLVPGLVFLCIPMKVAVGTDLTQIIASAAVGASTYYAKGDVDPIIGSLLMVGGILGTVFGTRLNKKLPAMTLRRLFGVIMIPIGLLMIRSALSGGISIGGH